MCFVPTYGTAVLTGLTACFDMYITYRSRPWGCMFRLFFNVSRVRLFSGISYTEFERFSPKTGLHLITKRVEVRVWGELQL